MAAYPFLSPEWTEAARELRAEYADTVPPAPVTMRMNLVVNDVPFGDGPLDAHLDTTNGDFVLEHGHLEGADLKITIDYATAKAILIEGNPQAGMHPRRRRHVEAARPTGRPGGPGARGDRPADEGYHRVGGTAAGIFTEIVPGGGCHRNAVTPSESTRTLACRPSRT